MLVLGAGDGSQDLWEGGGQWSRKEWKEQRDTRRERGRQLLLLVYSYCPRGFSDRHTHGPTPYHTGNWRLALPLPLGAGASQPTVTAAAKAQPCPAFDGKEGGSSIGVSSFTLTRHGGDDTIDGKDDAPRSQRRGGLCVGDWGPPAGGGCHYHCIR